MLWSDVPCIIQLMTSSQAKDKEQAVFHLYRTYGLEEVIWDNLRPEKSEEHQKNGGKRKSYAVDIGSKKDVSVAKKRRRNNGPDHQMGVYCDRHLPSFPNVELPLAEDPKAHDEYVAAPAGEVADHDIAEPKSAVPAASSVKRKKKNSRVPVDDPANRNDAEASSSILR
jgi:hypothetical protein